ncbi:MAG TPA: (d)CMP kinase, partial [Firmicutes bacterium]|nr:(d)CMP kinase [Bacillota bacterium]
MVRSKVIAIDGPAAAGKSTIAQKVAQMLGYVYIDTGAMYRAITYKALKNNVDVEDEAGIMALLDKTLITLTNDKKVFLDGEDVSEAIRQPEVSKNVSAVSAHKLIREELKRRQIQYAKTDNVVMDGRDIGTNVLPNADYKIFMTASVEVRATRRYKENLKRNITTDLESLKEEIRTRDELDSTRKHSPLLKADDAIVVDTSQMTIDEVVDRIITIVKGSDLMLDYIHKSIEGENKMVETNEHFDYGDFTLPRVGQIVEGEVVKVTPQEVIIDLNYATEGTIYLNELTFDKVESAKSIVKVGDKIQAMVKKVSDEAILLSRTAVLQQQKVEDLKHAFENQEVLEGQVVRSVKGGLIVNIGTEAFLPMSMIDVAFVTDAESFVGQTVQVKIIEFKGNKIKVSRKDVIAEQLKAKRKDQFETLAVNDIVEGHVVRIEKFGAFVRFGALEGLVHISEISHLPVENVEAALAVNQAVQAKVIKVDNGKIQLSIKAILPTPFEEFTSAHETGSVVNGTVTRLTDFGAFVEVAPGVEGLVHNSELSYDHKAKLEDILSEGKTIQVKIISADVKNKRLALSVKQLESDPWKTFNHNVGDVISGVISNMTEIGAFIKVAPYIEGLCHFTEASWNPTVKLQSVVNVGDEVEVKVISFDPKKHRLGLSLRQVKENPWASFKVSEGDVVNGVVESMTDRGAYVALAEDVVGFLPIGQISEKRLSKVEEVLSNGQSIDVKVMRLDLKSNRIDLSIRRIKEDAEREEFNKYMAEDN